MIGIIGRKLGMTQVFNEDGQQIPCTVVEATPNSVIKVLKKDQVGFDSVELGFGEQRHARESKKGERTPRGRRAHKAIQGWSNDRSRGFPQLPSGRRDAQREPQGDSHL